MYAGNDSRDMLKGQGGSKVDEIKLKIKIETRSRSSSSFPHQRDPMEVLC